MAKSKKLFVSTPMKGLTEDQVKYKFSEAEYIVKEKFKGQKIELIDTYIAEDPPKELNEDQRGLWYLGKSLEKLAEADIAFFQDGWSKTRGCIMENLVAKAYNVDTIICKENPTESDLLKYLIG